MIRNQIGSLEILILSIVKLLVNLVCLMMSFISSIVYIFSSALLLNQKSHLEQDFFVTTTLVLNPNEICRFKDICTFNRAGELCVGALKRQNLFICNLDKLREVNGKKK